MAALRSHLLLNFGHPLDYQVHSIAQLKVKLTIAMTLNPSFSNRNIASIIILRNNVTIPHNSFAGKLAKR